MGQFLLGGHPCPFRVGVWPPTPLAHPVGWTRPSAPLCVSAEKASSNTRDPATIKGGWRGLDVLGATADVYRLISHSRVVFADVYQHLLVFGICLHIALCSIFLWRRFLSLPGGAPPALGFGLPPKRGSCTWYCDVPLELVLAAHLAFTVTPAPNALANPAAAPTSTALARTGAA